MRCERLAAVFELDLLGVCEFVVDEDFDDFDDFDDLADLLLFTLALDGDND